MLTPGHFNDFTLMLILNGESRCCKNTKFHFSSHILRIFNKYTNYFQNIVILSAAFSLIDIQISLFF